MATICADNASFITRVCPSIPVRVSLWKRGKLVKGDTTIATGTAIATFNGQGQYHGHAAIYDSQNDQGINVVDQWVNVKATAIHPRLIRFGGSRPSNDGDIFYVVE